MTIQPVSQVREETHIQPDTIQSRKLDYGSLLVVDDDELNRELLRRRLERIGYQVTTLTRGDQVPPWIEEHNVDLILMDVTMPGMDGFETLKLLRVHHSSLQLPIIMVTGRSDSTDVVKALNLGANDYVTKPVDFPVCLARIRTQLSLKRAEEALRQSEERYALATRGANDGLWDWDLRANEVYFSSRWKAMLGWEEDGLASRLEEWFQRVHPDDLERLKNEIHMHLEGITDHYENEYRMLHRDGNYLWMLGRGIAVRDSSGKAYRMAGSQTDITRGKVADALTGLPNRLLFMDRLGRMLERLRHLDDYVIAVIFIDLDDFKLINDSLGHAAGDELLVAVARQLEVAVRSADTVARLGKGHTLARLGGDEFIILLDNIKTAENAVQIAKRIGKIFESPFRVAGQEVFASASMGIALSSTDIRKQEDLLRDADTAMYQAKIRGKGHLEIFDAEMRANVTARLQLDTELRHAVAKHEFEIHYQPIVSLKSGGICGFEALVRWQHPVQGLLPPDYFLKAAEESGLMVTIEEGVMAEVGRKLRNWQIRFPTLSNMTAAVNLCSKHFLKPELVSHLRQLLEETGLPSRSLTLEITETALMIDSTAAAEVMRNLKDLSVNLALDDFGTGYSSLSYLHRFPLDTLKIDRSFVSRMGVDGKEVEMVRTIITLAHSLDLIVIAEGVETIAQAAALNALGCEYAQGYYFSRPLRADSAADLIAANPRWEIK